jgi:CRISPR type I-E-associated protein CasB/Cse2
MSENALIARLRELAKREDRGALAALRRGLGKPPGAAEEMHHYVARFLPDEAWTWRNQCLYIVAALFGLHPAAAASGNMGHTFRAIQEATGTQSDANSSTERRFVSLLKCHRDDLFEHLRHAVSLAKAKDVAINWEQLLKDIQHWNSDDAWVQREWSRAFWGAAPEAGDDSEETANTTAKETQA